jgi:hypothetical protein
LQSTQAQRLRRGAGRVLYFRAKHYISASCPDLCQGLQSRLILQPYRTRLPRHSSEADS